MPTYAMTVTVRPEYLPSRSAPADDIYVFAYHITVTNVGEMAAQLISRTWNINDANGMHEKVKGLGLVGQQPLLQPGEQVFDFSRVAVADSSAVAVMLGWLRAADQSRSTLTFAEIPPGVRSLAELYGVTDLLPLV